MQQTTSLAPSKATAHSQSQSAHQERLLRIAAVQMITGIGRSTIYSSMETGDFPRAVRVHGNCVAWRESEINAWIENRPRATFPEKKVAA